MLNENQIGIYGKQYPRHCAVSDTPLALAHNQFSLGDNTHFVCVASSNVNQVTHTMLKAWSKQFVKTTSKKKDGE